MLATILLAIRPATDDWRAGRARITSKLTHRCSTGRASSCMLAETFFVLAVNDHASYNFPRINLSQGEATATTIVAVALSHMWHG